MGRIVMSGRRMLFCREYLRTGDAQSAALRAGYKRYPSTGKCNAARILADPKVRDFITRHNEIKTVRGVMERDEANLILSQAARALIPTVVEVKKDAGGEVKSSTETYSRVAAIDSLARKMGWEQDKADMAQGIIINIQI